MPERIQVWAPSGPALALFLARAPGDSAISGHPVSIRSYTQQYLSYAMAEKWRLEGTIFDACNCQVPCPCAYFQHPSNEDCRFAGVWHVEHGNHGKISLNNFNMALVGYTKQNPLMGIDKAGWILDEKLTKEQRDALTQILGGKAGGLFSMLSVKEPLGIWWAKFDHANDGKSWSVKAGDTLEIKAGFVKPPPGLPFEAKPKVAQSYDPLYGPSMDKVVGITDVFRVKVGGLDYDISGTNSPSGRFKYEGP